MEPRQIHQLKETAADGSPAALQGAEKLTIDQVKPVGENILVYPVPLMDERMLPSGIIIPDTQLEFHDKPRWGTVVAVGPKVTADIVPAQQILIREGSGVQMFFQDPYGCEIKEYLFVRKEHIEAVLSLGEMGE